MQFVLVIYHGAFPLPGSAAWKALPESEHKAIYDEYEEVNNAAGITLRPPPIAPGKATTVQVREGKVQVKEGRTLPKGSPERSCSMRRTSTRRLRWPRASRRPSWAVRWKWGRRAVLLIVLVSAQR